VEVSASCPRGRRPFGKNNPLFTWWRPISRRPLSTRRSRMTKRKVAVQDRGGVLLD
jgi:hypothetical protein